jgi:hypothetical protein
MESITIFQSRAKKIDILFKDNLIFLSQLDRFFDLRKNKIIITLSQLPKVVEIFQEIMEKNENKNTA